MGGDDHEKTRRDGHARSNQANLIGKVCMLMR